MAGTSYGKGRLLRPPDRVPASHEHSPSMTIVAAGRKPPARATHRALGMLGHIRLERDTLRWL